MITVGYHRVSERQEIVDDCLTPLPATFFISPVNFTLPATRDGHGVAIGRNPACCRRMVLHGLVDCVACLNEAWLALNEHLCPEERGDAQWVIDTVRDAGPAGVMKSKLMVRLVSEI